MMNPALYRQPPVSSGRPYSFIDDLLGGARQVTDDATAYRDQKLDLAMKLASMRENASPEQYSTMRQLYGDRFPEMFAMPHALDVVRGAQNPAPMTQPSSIDPERLRAAAGALFGQNNNLGLPSLAQVAGVSPMGQPAQQPVQPPQPQPMARVPISTSLTMAAGGLPTPSEANPFARLTPLMTNTLAGQDALLGRDNVPLSQAIELAGKKLTGDRPKTRLEIMNEQTTPMAGRGWVSAQDQAVAALDQKLSKMDIGEVMALVKAAAGQDKSTDTSRKVIADQQKAGLGEAKANNATNVAKAGAGVREAGKATDNRLKGLQTVIDTKQAELNKLMDAEKADTSVVAVGSKKIDRAVRKQRIADLRKDIVDLNAQVKEVTNLPK